MKEGKLNEGITTNQMMSRLQKKVKDSGGQAQLARCWGISPQSINNALTGQKLPSPAILAMLKLEPIKEIYYRYKELKK